MSGACPVILVMSLGLGWVKRCGVGFESYNFEGGRGWGKGQATKRGPVFMMGVDPSLHHEVGSCYEILLFWNSIESLTRYCKSLYLIPVFTNSPSVLPSYSMFLISISFPLTLSHFFIFIFQVFIFYFPSAKPASILFLYFSWIFHEFSLLYK